jgi:hypothetical protein
VKNGKTKLKKIEGLSGPSFFGDAKYLGKEKCMKTLIIAGIIALALPFAVLGQTTEEPQQTQAPTKETQTTTAPTKGKKTRADQDLNKPEGKPETGANVRGQTNMNQSTKVNVQEFKSRHSEVFNLGRHPKEFFIQRFGANHFRLIGNTYFVFVDSCWVAVNVEGFGYTERVICPGDPEFIEVD